MFLVPFECLIGSQKRPTSFGSCNFFLSKPQVWMGGPSPKDIIAQVTSTTKYLAMFEAKSGYWQIAFDDDSKPLTTFNTEWGCYWYQRLPMRLASSGDKFCARTDKALTGIQESLNSSTISSSLGTPSLNCWIGSRQSSHNVKTIESH